MSQWVMKSYAGHMLDVYGWQYNSFAEMRAVALAGAVAYDHHSEIDICETVALIVGAKGPDDPRVIAELERVPMWHHFQYCGHDRGECRVCQAFGAPQCLPRAPEGDE